MGFLLLIFSDVEALVNDLKLKIKTKFTIGPETSGFQMKPKIEMCKGLRLTLAIAETKQVEQLQDTIGQIENDS